MEEHMRQNSQNLSFQVNGPLAGSSRGPLSEAAARLASFIDNLPIEIASAKNCRLEVSGTEIHIFGVQGGLDECSITDPSKVTNVSVRNGLVIVDVNCPDFNRIVIHTSQSSGAGTSSPYARSGGEGRSGYAVRSGG